MDPVFYHPGGELYSDGVYYEAGWYYWDETWSDADGPFASKREAERACEAYAEGI